MRCLILWNTGRMRIGPRHRIEVFVKYTVRVLQWERGEKACRFEFCTRIACLVYGSDGEESDARHTPKPPKKIIRDAR